MGIFEALASKMASGIGNYGAAQTQADAANNANNAYNNEVNNGVNYTQGVYNTAQGNLNPYIAGGGTELPQYQNAVDNYTQAANPTVSQSFDINNWKDPGYAFRLDQANQAIEGSTASKGMTLGSGALKSLQTRNQDMASQEYANAYDRYNTDANRQFNQNQQIYNNNMENQNQNITNRQNLSTLGYTAANALNGVGENTAGQLNGLYTGLGTVGAASQTAQGQANANKWLALTGALGGTNNDKTGGTNPGMFSDLGSLFGGSSNGTGGGWGSTGGASGTGGMA